MKLQRSTAIGAIALLFSGLPSAAHAQYTFIDKNTTIDFDFYAKYVIVGYANYEDYSGTKNKKNVTVNLVEKGILRDTVQVYNTSFLRIDKGVFKGNYLELYDNCQTIMTEGDIQAVVTAFNESHFKMEGGTARTLTLRDNSLATITGGNFSEGIQLFELGSAKLSNVSVGALYGWSPNTYFNLTSVTCTGGISSNGVVNATDLTTTNGMRIGSGKGGFFTLQSGSISGTADAYGGFMRLQGGTVNGINVSEGGTVKVEGAKINGPISVIGSSSLDLPGGEINGKISASNSTVSIAGATVVGDLSAVGNSSVSLMGGSIWGLDGSHNSTLSLNGTSVLGNAVLRGDSHASMAGGAIGGSVTLFGGARFAISGGSVAGFLTSYGQSTADIIGGTVGQIMASESSSVSVRGGIVGGNFSTFDSANGDLSGALVNGHLSAFGTSTISMTGGIVTGSASAYDKATMWISGGIVGGGNGGNRISPGLEGLFAEDSAHLGIRGMGLTATLMDENVSGLYSLYHLSGTLADGGSIEGMKLYVRNGTGASFELQAVPEPGTLAVVGIGLAALLRRRRRRV